MLPISNHNVSQLADLTKTEHSKIFKKAIVVTFAVAILAATASIVVQIICLPLGVDGGVYSYPAFSMSRGDDPGESQLTVKELRVKEGIRGTFGYDVSRTVRILPLSWWIGTFGANIWSLRAFGLMEMAVLVALMFLVLWAASKDPPVALLLWALYITDSVILALGSSDLRPDTMVTTLTLIVFVLLHIKPEKSTTKVLLFILAILVMFFLSGIHVTAVIPLSFLACYMFARIVLEWRTLSKTTKILYVSFIISGGLGFLLRRTLCAILVPSQYLDRIGTNTVVDVEKSVFELLRGGILPIIEKEYSRWVNYFYPYNLPLLCVIFVAVLLFGANMIGSPVRKPPSSQMSILAGLICALVVLALDPHPWAAHALPVMPFFFILLAKEIQIASHTRLKHVVISLLIAFTLLSAGAKIAFAARVAVKCTQNGLSNRALVHLMKQIFREDKNYLVVGPTEIWPYINPKTNVTIFDAKLTKLGELSWYLNRIDYLIIDKDYKGYHWEKRFREKYPTVAIVTVAEVGDENSGWPFLKVMKPVLQQ